MGRLAFLPKPFRWQLGLLLLSLPRRFIAGRLRQLAAGRADEPLPYPVGHARPGQVRRLPYQLLVLGGDPDVQGRRMAPPGRNLFHGESVLPEAGQVKRIFFAKPLDICIAIGYTLFTVETERWKPRSPPPPPAAPAAVPPWDGAR